MKMSELEPEDSRNVTGTAATKDGRWTNKDGKPPKGVPDNTGSAPKKASSPTRQAK